MLPSCPRVWQLLCTEPLLNVDVSDAELARELAIPWKYFVLFVSIDDEQLTGSTVELSTRTSLRTAIERKQCHGDQLPFVFGSNLLRDGLMGRIVVAFTPRVDVEEATSKATALCCVSYSLNPNVACVATASTAGFSFVAAGERSYVITSLHGRHNANRQQPQGRRNYVLLADAFATDDEKLTGATEVGHVVVDWRNDNIDVGLVQLHDEHTTPAVWYPEAEVVAYMVALIKSTHINYTVLRYGSLSTRRRVSVRTRTSTSYPAC